MNFHDVTMLHFFMEIHELSVHPWLWLNEFTWISTEKKPFSSGAGSRCIWGLELVWCTLITKGFINQSVSAWNTIWVLVLTNYVAYVPQRKFRTIYWNPHQHLFRKRYVINEIRLLQCKGSLWKPHIHYSYQRKYVSFLNYHIQEIVLFP